MIPLFGYVHRLEGLIGKAVLVEQGFHPSVITLNDQEVPAIFP